MEDVSVVDMSLEQWKSTFDINMTSSFLVVREYLKQLAQATSAERTCFRRTRREYGREVR